MIRRLCIQCHDIGKVVLPGLVDGHFHHTFILSSFSECLCPNSSLEELTFDKTISYDNNLILTQFILSSQGPLYISTSCRPQWQNFIIGFSSKHYQIMFTILHNSYFILFFSLMLWFLPFCPIHNCFSLFIILDHFLIIKIIC